MLLANFFLRAFILNPYSGYLKMYLFLKVCLTHWFEIFNFVTYHCSHPDFSQGSGIPMPSSCMQKAWQSLKSLSSHISFGSTGVSQIWSCAHSIHIYAFSFQCRFHGSSRNWLIIQTSQRNKPPQFLVLNMLLEEVPIPVPSSLVPCKFLSHFSNMTLATFFSQGPIVLAVFSFLTLFVLFFQFRWVLFIWLRFPLPPFFPFDSLSFVSLIEGAV